MDLYIKPVKKASIAEKKLVYLKDIAEVYTPEGRNEKIENVIILEIKEDKKKTYLVSVIDVIRSITNMFPEYTVNNVGEMDIVVEYSPKHKEDNQAVLWLKVAFIFIVLFAGASTAIMSFHADGEIPTILKNYYYIFFREYIDLPSILVIPYSIGLGIGIIAFFNHFSRFFLTKDPTPIEVQMTTYENETITNIVDTLSRAQNKEGKPK